MRSRKLWFGMICGSLLAGSASAISVDGNWADWLTPDPIPNSQLNSAEWDLAANGIDFTSAVDGYALDLPEGTGQDQQTPGGGGQDYDNEMIMWSRDWANDRIYVGLVTGFNPAGVSTYDGGDLFLDIDNDGSYEYAVGTSTNDGRDDSTWYDAGGLSTIGVVFDNNPVGEPNYTASNPWRAAGAATGTDAGAFIFGNYSGAGVPRYFYEFCIDLSSTVDWEHKEIGLHWTMECGNDNINAVSPVPVPAAAPMVLFGLGLLGLGRKMRRA